MVQTTNGVCVIWSDGRQCPLNTKMEKPPNGEIMACVLREFKSYKIDKFHLQYVCKILSTFGTATGNGWVARGVGRK